MATYLILLAPSANRVYADRAPYLVAAELLAWVPSRVCGDVRDVEPVRLAGVPYLAVDIGDDAADLSEQARTAIGTASAFQALYRRHTAGEEPHTAGGDLERILLEPLAVPTFDILPSDLLTIPKYTGKTNEQFTKLLLNVTIAATAWPHRLFERDLTVLDPMCGRGTSLSQALTYGLRAVGVDVDRRDATAYETFLGTWLKTHRYKHEMTRTTIRRSGTTLGHGFSAEFAADPGDYKAGRRLRLDYHCVDTTALRQMVRAASVDVIVADTPYGVQHGSQQDRLVRDPAGLLDRALPGWVETLRVGGALGLAYNRHVVSAPTMRELITRHGLTPVEPPRPEAFRHRVDRAIDRDIIVARKFPTDRHPTDRHPIERQDHG